MITTICTSKALLERIEECSDVVEYEFGTKPTQMDICAFPFIFALCPQLGGAVTLSIYHSAAKQSHVSNHEFISKCAELFPKKNRSDSMPV